MNNLQLVVADNTRYAMHVAVELCENGEFDSVTQAFRWLMEGDAEKHGSEPDQVVAAGLGGANREQMDHLDICPCCGARPAEFAMSTPSKFWLIECPDCHLAMRGIDRQANRDAWNSRVPYEDEWEVEGGKIVAIVKGGTRFVREQPYPTGGRQRIDALQSMIARMVKANRRLHDEVCSDRAEGGPGATVPADAMMAWLDSIIDLDAIRDLGIELEKEERDA